ncbi:hypothetical protein AAFF_G00191190 [Aldrovandia affinis]|uniref:Uncharacterized protein n=1 Tax=Aldrovandia affinis TaxID=143900 RepID=A0AAD7W660_9TELE|nr:hypothetical protein AAFF_G00191190 [Aldrovandia affinis]
MGADTVSDRAELWAQIHEGAATAGSRVEMRKACFTTARQTKREGRGREPAKCGNGTTPGGRRKPSLHLESQHSARHTGEREAGAFVLNHPDKRALLRPSPPVRYTRHRENKQRYPHTGEFRVLSISAASH